MNADKHRLLKNKTLSPSAIAFSPQMNLDTRRLLKKQNPSAIRHPPFAIG